MIFVTGASGTIGSRLVRRLVSRGHRTRGLVLPGDPLRHRLDHLRCEIVEGDITRTESLVGVFDGISTVYHLAAVILPPDPGIFARINVTGTRNVVEAAAAAGVRHLIYVSSASVVYPRPTHYSRSKREGERLVRSQRRMAYTIVRPTLVYEEQGGEEFLRFVAAVDRFPLVPLVGDGRAKKRPVHAEDLIDGLAAIAGHRQAFGRTYNLSGGETVTIRQLVELVLSARKKRKPIVPLPVGLCRAVAWTLGLFLADPPLSLQAVAGLTQHADLDPVDAMRDLAYAPIGASEGIPRCLDAVVASTTETTACQHESPAISA